MVPLNVFKDYYAILEVAAHATPDTIVKSYKRLARKLHPDRNRKQDTTAAFQLLGEAYDTLKDSFRRREHDERYAHDHRDRARSHNQPTASAASPPSSTPRPHPPTDVSNELAQIAALLLRKKQRQSDLYTENNRLHASNHELRNSIQQIKHEINMLHSAMAVTAAQEARQKGWAAWLLCPVFGISKPSEHEEAQWRRLRQDRDYEKETKLRCLAWSVRELKKQEDQLQQAAQDTANAAFLDDMRLGTLSMIIRAKLAGVK